MKYLLGIILAMMMGVSHANDWTDEDTARQAAVLTLFAVDAGQTLDIKHHANLRETNPILGSHPTDSRVKTYFVLAAVVHTAASYYLTPEYRRYLQNGTIVLELAVIGNNKRLGLNIKW